MHEVGVDDHILKSGVNCVRRDPLLHVQLVDFFSSRIGLLQSPLESAKGLGRGSYYDSNVNSGMEASAMSFQVQ